jgi:glutamate-1-semialdehyde 2,1-aminomutase
VVEVLSDSTEGKDRIGRRKHPTLINTQFRRIEKLNMTRSTPAGYDQDRLHTIRVREDAMFRSHIPRSLDLAARARRSMPNGVPMAWMAGLYRHPPLFVVEGSGARFRDVDGNTYLDMNQSDMSMNCGYGSPSVVAAGSERLLHGSQFLLPTEDAIVVSEMLAEHFGIL